MHTTLKILLHGCGFFIMTISKSSPQVAVLCWVGSIQKRDDIWLGKLVKEVGSAVDFLVMTEHTWTSTGANCHCHEHILLPLKHDRNKPKEHAQWQVGGIEQLMMIFCLLRGHD